MDSIFKAIATAAAVSLLIQLIQIFRLAFHLDLTSIPGPFLNRFSNAPLKLRNLTGRRTKYIHSLHLQYGTLIRIAPGELSTSSITSHRQIHRIGTEFQKAPWYQSLSPAQYDDSTCGVFGIRNPKVASARRKLFQQVGTKACVKLWEGTVKSLAKETVAKIRRDCLEKGKADVAVWWSLMTSDVLGSLAFGESFRMIEQEKKAQLIHDIDNVMIFGGLCSELPFILHLLKNIPLPKIGRPTYFFKRYATYGEIAIRNTKAAWQNANKAQTLFSKMVPEDSSMQTVPDDVVARESSNIIAAGSDTTSTALTYLVFAVLSHPEVKANLIAELKTCSADPDWEELDTKAYLNRVIQETLRLYAPIPATLPRIAPNGTMLESHKIPGDVVVGTQAHTFHRDPTVYENPESFNPDRWINPTQEMKDNFQTFGGNARICLGQNIVRLELLHAVSLFFRTCPNAVLTPSTNDKTMDWIDFFIIKPSGGKCEITIPK